MVVIEPNPEMIDPEFNAPTPVSDEPVTPAASVAPVSVPAGATTATLLAAVIRPFPFTVNVGIAVEPPKDPTFPFTVASVVERLPATVVTSPVSAGKRAAARVPVTLVPERLTAFAVIC